MGQRNYTGINWDQYPAVNEMEGRYQSVLAGLNPTQTAPNLSMNWGGSAPQTPLIYQPEMYNQIGGLNQTGINALNTSGQQSTGSGLWGGFKGLFEDGGALNMGKVDPKTGQFMPSGLNMGLQAGMGLFNAWGGMQKLNLAKKQFNFQKDAYNKNYENQKTLTNSRLEDRQNARNAFSDNHEKTDSYMERNRIN